MIAHATIKGVPVLEPLFKILFLKQMKKLLIFSFMAILVMAAKAEASVSREQAKEKAMAFLQKIFARIGRQLPVRRCFL